MPDRRLIAFVPAVVLFGGVLLVHGTRDQVAMPLRGDLAGVLRNPAGYRAQDQVVSEEEQRVAGMSDYVARVYWRDSSVAFTTYVGYYEQQAQGKSIHSPRNCLPGAGWEILRTGAATLPVGAQEHTVNKYVLKNGRLEAVVYYWYQGRGRVVANEYAVKWNLLRDAALKGHTEEALVRVVVPVQPGPGGLAEADALGADVAARLLAEVSDVLPAPTARPDGVVALRTVE